MVFGQSLYNFLVENNKILGTDKSLIWFLNGPSMPNLMRWLYAESREALAKEWHIGLVTIFTEVSTYCSDWMEKALICSDRSQTESVPIILRFTVRAELPRLPIGDERSLNKMPNIFVIKLNKKKPSKLLPASNTYNSFNKIHLMLNHLYYYKRHVL